MKKYRKCPALRVNTLLARSFQYVPPEPRLAGKSAKVIFTMQILKNQPAQIVTYKALAKKKTHTYIHT